MAHTTTAAVLRTLKNRTNKSDKHHFCFAALVFLISFTHLFLGWTPWLSPRVTIGIVDVYVGVFLVLASLSVGVTLPARQTALLTMPCLFLVLVMSFASRYIDDGHVQRTTPKHETDELKDPRDAAYFSLVTITTVGYGDWLPNAQSSYKIVEEELVSGAMLLLLLIPLLASRLALLDEPSGGLTVIGLTRLKDGGWRIEQTGQPTRTFAKSDTLALTIYPDGSVTQAH